MTKPVITHKEALAKERECSFNNPETLENLKLIVKDHVSSQQYNEFSPDIRESGLIKYHPKPPLARPNEFCVTRQSRESAFKPRIGQHEEFDESVNFTVEGRNLRIAYIKKTEPSANVRETIWERIVSPVITRSGECRYATNGIGRDTLWEIVLDALKPLCLPDLV